MGERQSVWTRLRDIVPIVFLSAAFSVGAFASMTQSANDRLDRKIDVVSSVAKSDLDAAVRIRTVQMEALDNRMRAEREAADRQIAELRQIAKDNSETFRRLSEGQAVIVANISYQSSAIDTMGKKLDAHMDRTSHQ